jgi:ASPIC and UnbV
MPPKPMAQHIGLGKGERIVDLEVTWPSSDTTETFSRINANQFSQITELQA